MSRKLIYVSGLLTCYRCHMDFTPEGRMAIFGDSKRHKEIVEHIEAMVRETPLEIVAGVLLRFPHLNEAARKILGSYDEFLGLLEDEKCRLHLDGLIENEADEDETYQRARRLSHAFRDGLLDVFFDRESGLDVLTRNYGVF